MRFVWAAGVATSMMCVSSVALAAATIDLSTIDVDVSTPLSKPSPGADVSKVPSAVTTVDSKEVSREKAPTVVKALDQQTPSIQLQTVTGNDLQPDVIFRGFDASPVQGTPQGLAVYQNGMRINEAFGDTVNWDMVPPEAIKSIDVISNNPAFGLNALGGAVAMQMKDGFNFQGGTLDLMGGSYGRAQASLQYGKQVGNWGAYIEIDGTHDNGYRKFGGSDLRRIYGDIGYKAEQSEFHISAGGASNNFGAAGTSPFELLQSSWSNVYTTPQSALNQMGFVNANANVQITPTWSLQANAHARTFYQSTQDGNPTDVQPCDPADGGAAGFLCFNDDFTPANGLNGKQLVNTFPADAVLGENDRTQTQSTTVGTSLQATNTDKLFGHLNHFVVGASFDYSVTHFGSSAELGVINPDYTISGSGVFIGNSGDPTTIGPVSLKTTNAYTGLYAVDAFDVTDKFTITAGGRFNLANIRLDDQLGTSLNGGGDYMRFNPLIGGTYKITPELSAYAGYSEANRAPVPLELGCADPMHPCILATFLVADPPLKQVIAHTMEMGLRGSHAIGENNRIGWKLGVFRTDTSNEILNVPDPDQPGYGYFQNVGGTRRQGVEAHVDYRTDKLTLAANYAYLDATFLNAFQLGSNSPFADADGNIQVNKGNTMPMMPHHRFKFSADYDVTPEFTIGGDLNVVSSSYFDGDASNQYPQMPGYWFADLSASYQITKNIKLYAKVDNVTDNRFYTYGTFFDTGAVPNFANGGNPFTDPRSLTPARPRAFYAGLRATF